MSSSASVDLGSNISGGGGGGGVTSLNTLTGALTLVAGTNITVTPSGSNITISSTGSGVTTMAAVGSSPNANGATIATTTLTLQPASASFPGVVTIGAQTIAGAKTFSTAPILSSLTASTALVLDGSKNVASLAYSATATNSSLAQRDGSGNLVATNLSGTNTGDVTLAAVGASPSANGASLSGQVLTLQPFDSTHPGVVTASGGGTSNFLRADGSFASPQTGIVQSLGITVSGAGSTITTGTKGFLYVPYACTINSVTVLADASGSIVFDIKKAAYASFPPSSSIVASAPPTLSSAQKSQDLTLTGWTTAISAGDVLAFSVSSATTVQQVSLTLKVTR